MEYDNVIKKMKAGSTKKNVEGITRFGINPENTLGLSMPFVRLMAKETGKDHIIAQRLWDSGIHEARILAGLVDNPKEVTEKQMDSWVNDFDSWDVCDQVVMNLFDKTPFAYKKAIEWSKGEEEFVRRAGFTLMASLSVHDKNAADSDFEQFFPQIEKASTDERNFVRKAVNWALRQIGKRNLYLNQKAIELGKKIQKKDSKSARWIAADALRELQSEQVRKKIEGRK